MALVSKAVQCGIIVFFKVSSKRWSEFDVIKMEQKVIQYMIAKGCVEVDELKTALSEDTQMDDDKMSHLVQTVNRKITKFNIMIRGSMDEVTGKRYFVLISTVDNEVTKAASHHSPKEFEFFKLVLQEIVHNPRGIITHNALKDIAEKATISTSKTRSGTSEYKGIFREWCNKNWLLPVTEDGEDYITLGVRALAELDVFIKQKLIENPADLECKSCKNLSIYSSNCPTCDARFHKRCSKVSINKDEQNCKECQPRVVESTSGSRRR